MNNCFDSANMFKRFVLFIICITKTKWGLLNVFNGFNLEWSLTEGFLIVLCMHDTTYYLTTSEIYLTNGL